MATIIQSLYEEITNELKNLKIGEDEDQVNINSFLKMIPCLSYHVYINKTNWIF